MDDTTSATAQGGMTGAALGPWGALAGAVLGGILGAKEKKNQERSRRENAMINMYAPLFGQAPQALAPREDTSSMGALQGLMGGYQFGRSMQNDKNLMNMFGSANPNTTTTVPTSNEFVPYVDQTPKIQFSPYLTR